MYYCRSYAPLRLCPIFEVASLIEKLVLCTLIAMATIRTEFLVNETVAILRMTAGENRLNHNFLVEYNKALDNIERYVPAIDTFHSAMFIFPT